MKTAIILFLTAAAAFAQDKDPFVKADAAKAPVVEEGPRSPLAVRYEAFSLPMAEAAALLRKAPGDAELYRELASREEKGSAKLESQLEVRANSGQRAEASIVSEEIYPTEYTLAGAPKPAAPDKDGKPVAAAPAPGLPEATGVAPTAFETRNCGSSIEVEPVIGERGSWVELRIKPQHVTKAEIAKWGEGPSEIKLPTFEAQDITSMVMTTLGQPCFLGTINRPPASILEEKSPRRVWFAFVTVNIARK